MASLPTRLALSTPPMAAMSPSLPLTTITSLSAIGTSDGGAASRLAARLATGLAGSGSRSRLPLLSLPLAEPATAPHHTSQRRPMPARPAAVGSQSRLSHLSLPQARPAPRRTSQRILPPD